MIQTHQFSAAHLQPTVSTTCKLYACLDFVDWFSKLPSTQKKELQMNFEGNFPSILHGIHYQERIILANLWWIRLPWMTTKDPALTSIGTKSF